MHVGWECVAVQAAVVCPADRCTSTVDHPFGSPFPMVVIVGMVTMPVVVAPAAHVIAVDLTRPEDVTESSVRRS